MNNSSPTSLQIQLVTTTELEISWDSYVANHAKAAPYHKFAWVKSIEQTYKHQNVSLIATIDNKVVGILPCIAMLKPLAKPTFCSLPFCDIGYALSDNHEITHALKQHALAQLTAANAHVFEYRDTQDSVVNERDKPIKVRMLLTLPGSADALMEGFKSKLRSQIRKAEKNGLTYTINQNSQSIANFYTIFAKNMRKLGSPVHSKQWFENLINHYGSDVFLAVVYKQAIPIGAGLIIRNAKKVAIPWASTDADYNYLAPNMMLYWALMQHACELGCTEFDFGRSTFGEGTFKFKQQWGAEPVALLWSDLNSSQTESELTPGQPSTLRKFVETAWSHLPLGLTIFLGPKIRKYISL
ncbi:FemAB family XrtA/PEP-CTERM system-associated protein [Paraglaciecola hydrolytica]|uniref:FemAB family XrtA/PEP-CTERM system-associated protein n=1 Tax=Paraglaciecola hydrolytica TaxID=1799789 RepID=UPI000837FF06|nr:FemAB family XrtA/PEP-CTERM system-associated protein [Paraglaciecola hydrolytica]